jgi:hypothetical protein
MPKQGSASARSGTSVSRHSRSNRSRRPLEHQAVAARHERDILMEETIPAQPITRFPESGLFIEEPNISPDGRWLV